MKATKIQNSEIEGAAVASLPTRPNAKSGFGGRGLSATEMKEAFDALPLLVIRRYNTLLDDIAALGEDSLSGSIGTGILEGHSLADLFSDIENGNFASYMMIGDTSLAATLAVIKSRLDALDGGADA